jgi:hypothetical protein
MGTCSSQWNRLTRVRNAEVRGSIPLCSTIQFQPFTATGHFVEKDVPDFALVIGVRASIIGWVCECGARLELNAELTSNVNATCRVCERAYENRNALRQRL